MTILLLFSGGTPTPTPTPTPAGTAITLPDTPAPNGVEVALLDYGFIQRPASGAAALRVDRPGTRYRVTISWPPMVPATARVFMARFQVAKRKGLRVEFPLLDAKQGVPGAPVVDGAGQSGTTVSLRGLTDRYVCKEGYWLTLIDSDGVRYLHNCAANAVADSDGKIDIELTFPLRAPFADGDTALMAKPQIEGLLSDELNWSLSVDRLVRGGSITIEEAG